VWCTRLNEPKGETCNRLDQKESKKSKPVRASYRQVKNKTQTGLGHVQKLTRAWHKVATAKSADAYQVSKWSIDSPSCPTLKYEGAYS